MFNLEGFIPKLCQLAQEAGEEEKANRLRSAGLQALSSLVSFGNHKHGKEKFILMNNFQPNIAMAFGFKNKGWNLSSVKQNSFYCCVKLPSILH